jgi:succinyl-diaminopimelate desuccinylase
MKDFLKKLINAESTRKTGELETAKIIQAEFASAGIKSDVDVWDKNRANVITHIPSTGRKAPLVFACHIDVVGPGEGKWQHPPFEAFETDGKIYGRGSTDMKGGVASSVTAIIEVVKAGTALAGDIIFMGCAGEETDSSGAEKFVQNYNLPKPAGVVIPEPTDFMIVTAHRGLLWLEITTKGKAAHSSTPHLGINAIYSMQAVLNELRDFKINYQPNELLGGCSMSINTISGGNAFNVVPDKCTLGVDIRTVPGQNYDDIINDIKTIFSRIKSENPDFDAQISISRDAHPLLTDNNSYFVRTFCGAVNIEKTSAVVFTTDGPYFASLGVPVVIFGPGNPQICHQPDEFIKIADLQTGVDYYRKIIQRFLT